VAVKGEHLRRPVVNGELPTGGGWCNPEERLRTEEKQAVFTEWYQFYAARRHNCCFQLCSKKLYKTFHAICHEVFSR
jgi:hypothetical protein